MAARATITTYDVGDAVRVSAVWTDADSTAVDPDVVRFKFRTPNGTLTTYVYLTDTELVRDSTGNYHVDLSVTNSPGNWLYRFEGETSGGAAQGAAESYFTAKASSVL